VASARRLARSSGILPGDRHASVAPAIVIGESRPSLRREPTAPVAAPWMSADAKGRQRHRKLVARIASSIQHQFNELATENRHMVAIPVLVICANCWNAFNLYQPTRR
jgi:hypothetical protein